MALDPGDRPARRRRVVRRVARALTHREGPDAVAGRGARRADRARQSARDAPRFSAELMPETTRSGRCFTPPPSAQSTASAGKPFTATARVAAHASSTSTCSSDAGSGVARSPVPLSSSAGATTVTLDVRQLAQRLTSTSMPGALHAVVVRDEHPQRRRVRRRTGGDRSDDERARSPSEHQTPAHAANVAERRQLRATAGDGARQLASGNASVASRRHSPASERPAQARCASERASRDTRQRANGREPGIPARRERANSQVTVHPPSTLAP